MQQTSDTLPVGQQSQDWPYYPTGNTCSTQLRKPVSQVPQGWQPVDSCTVYLGQGRVYTMAEDLQDPKKGLAVDPFTVKHEIELKNEEQVGFSLPLSLAAIMCCPVLLNTL